MANDYSGNPVYLTEDQRERICWAVGMKCGKCENRIPQGGSVCSEVTDVEVVHEVARAYHIGGAEKNGE